MSQSQSHDTLHGIAAKLISRPEVIVVFKKDTSQETIDKQVSAIEQNGGSVKMFDNPAILKVRDAVLDLRTYSDDAYSGIFSRHSGCLPNDATE
jgi:hypothetical protein